MNLSSIATKLVVGLGILAAVLMVGFYIGLNRETNKCAVQMQDVSKQIASATVAAEKKATDMQKQLDDQEMASLRAKMAIQAELVSATQQKADNAQQNASRLTTELARLRKNDPTIEAWASKCLPANLLSSLHGSGEAPNSNCK